MNEIKNDINLRKAISRKEEKLPPMPSDLNERLMQRLQEEEKPSRRRTLPIALRWMTAAAVLVAVLALFTWKSQTSKTQPQNAETTAQLAPQEDTLKVIEKDNVVKSQTTHVKIANVTRYDRKRNTRRLESSQPTIADEPQTSTETPVLANAADSLYYYLTQLENQMGDCRDSTCLAELGNLMQADERIKDLVNKIIHKQVETAYKEEYLVDTTTRYIPL